MRESLTRELKVLSRIHLSVIAIFHQVREAFAYASSIFATATMAL
jgi:hypothetical protein